jgi:hypothetical protein
MMVIGVAVGIPGTVESAPPPPVTPPTSIVAESADLLITEAGDYLVQE